MILKRENYTDLPLWRWAQLRAVLAWARMSGGFSRALGLEREKLNLHSLGERPLSREIPELTRTLDDAELTLAAAICPTRAIQQTSKKWQIETQLCVRCGLCYVCAPTSLAPRTAQNFTAY
ncbi:MAG: hypothetical protein ACLGG7_12475 [Bacteriovoracia bacterium]